MIMIAIHVGETTGTISLAKGTVGAENTMEDISRDAGSAMRMLGMVVVPN